ncbi:SDR family oxidoreductase, partial [Streptomyces sp. NPDC002920]
MFADGSTTLSPASAEIGIAVTSGTPSSSVDRFRAALGPSAEDPGPAYSWAKHGVRRFVRR